MNFRDTSDEQWNIFIQNRRDVSNRLFLGSSVLHDFRVEDLGNRCDDEPKGCSLFPASSALQISEKSWDPT